MTFALVFLSLLLVIPIGAYPIVSPPSELLAPVANDFPRPGPPISLDDRWEDLTAGTNLALGKSYRFVRIPNYSPTRDEDDIIQLTDGKLVDSDRIWYSKQAVGYTSAEPPALICIDLEEVQPIDAVVVRIQGGGAHEASFRYPLRFDIMVSDDGEVFHLVDSISKREFADQQGALFDLPEAETRPAPGNPHPHAFNFGNLQTRGRYVAVEMVFPTAYSALDEIAVMAGDHDVAQVTFLPGYERRIVFDAIELLYPNPYIMVPDNVAGGFSFAVRDSRPADERTVPFAFHISVPAGVHLSWSADNEFPAGQDVTRNGRPYRQYTLETGTHFEGNRVFSYLSYFYIYGTVQEGDEIYFHASGDHFTQPEQSVALLPISIPPAPVLKDLVSAHGWTGVNLQSRWPGAPQAMRHLGFTHASVGSWEMPSMYERPETAESQRWIEEEARGIGLQLCLTDSPFHIMEALWRNEEDFAEAYYQGDPPRQQLCLSYRGKYYQKEIERIVQRYTYRKPDIIVFDVECFGHAKNHVQECGRCKPLWEASGKDPVDFATDLFAEASHDIARAINAAADELGRPHPQIGYYLVGPDHVYHNVLDFFKMYPEGIQFACPEIYVRCWPPAVADIVRAHRSKVPQECRVISYMSPGTFNWEGPVRPARYFDALLTQFFNGGSGTGYYMPIFFSPGDLQSKALAARVVAPVEDIIIEGRLIDEIPVHSENGVAWGLQHGEEAIMLVGEFHHLGDITVSVDAPVAVESAVVDMFTGETVGRFSPDNSRLEITVSGAYRTRPLYIGNRWDERLAEVQESAN